MKRLVCFAMAGLLAASAAVAQGAVTNEDVVKLAKSGLSEEFILDMVKKQPSKLSGEPSKLIELKQAGLKQDSLMSTQKERNKELEDELSKWHKYQIPKIKEMEANQRSLL